MVGADFLPGNFRISVFKRVWQAAAGFRDNLETSLDDSSAIVILFERVQRNPLELALNMLNRIEHIV